MFPREHGAYGQLLFPIATAMAIGRPGAGALCFAAAVTCAFLAHEPLLVSIGGRGVRAQREDRHRAKHWLLAFVILAFVFGAAAMALLPPPARRATLVSAAFGAALVIVVLAGYGRTVAGEAMSAVALASAALPIGLASNASLVASTTVAVVFAAGMASAAIAVRAVIARTRNPPAIAARVAAAVAAIAANAAVIGLGHANVVDHSGGLSAHPLAVASIALAVIAPAAKHLRRVGWTLVAATTVTAVLVAATLR